MERQPVTSSRILSVGYDPATQTLEVEFKNKKVAEYTGVPQSVYDGLMAAVSIGIYFGAHIAGKFPYSYV